MTSENAKAQIAICRLAIGMYEQQLEHEKEEKFKKTVQKNIEMEEVKLDQFKIDYPEHFI